MEGWIEPEVINENAPDKEDGKENDQQNDILNNNGHQQFEEMEMNKCNNVLPIIGELKESY